MAPLMSIRTAQKSFFLMKCPQSFYVSKSWFHKKIEHMITVYVINYVTNYMFNHREGLTPIKVKFENISYMDREHFGKNFSYEWIAVQFHSCGVYLGYGFMDSGRID